MTTVSEVHMRISQHAADIANRMIAEDDMLSHYFQGQVFIESAAHSGLRNSDEFGIAIRYIVNVDQYEESDVLHDGLRHVGKKACTQALSDMGHEFAGLIIGEARAGRNYFDNFKRGRR